MLLENACFPEDVRVLVEANSLVKAGYEVTVIAPTGKKWIFAETIDGVHVYRYPAIFASGGFVAYVWEYGYSIVMMFLLSTFVLFRRGFDVVHVHTPPDMTAIVAIFFQWLGKKFVFDHHDLSPELYLARKENQKPNRVYHTLRFFERLACRSADRLIATNTTQQSVQINRCGAEANNCYVVRNGPNEQFFGEVEPRPELQKSGQLVIGYVGELSIQDGVDYMVRAIQQLASVHKRTDFIAVIVGGGPALNDLKMLAEELGVADRIVFTGMIPWASVPAYIASFDICLTPDPSNPYNDSCTTLKTMEYMALRKPIVCFCTTENQLTAGEAALYANNNDVGEFACLISRLMDNAELRRSMGEVARNRILDGLSWHHQEQQLLALYEDLFPGRGSADRAIEGSGDSKQCDAKKAVTVQATEVT